MNIYNDVVHGTTDVSVLVRTLDSITGEPRTDVVFNSPGVAMWYIRTRQAPVSITEVGLGGPSSDHLDGGFIHVLDGFCRLDLPDAAVLTGVPDVTIGGSGTGLIIVGALINLIAAARATTVDVAALQADIDNIQSRLPPNLLNNRMVSTMSAIDDDANAASNLRRGVLGDVVCTVGVGSSPTSIVTSSMVPAAVTTGQFIGRILTFDRNTTTAALRGQATNITASTSGGVLTVTALTTSAVSGDTFTIT